VDSDAAISRARVLRPPALSGPTRSALPIVTALLASFVWPGADQYRRHRRRLGALLAAPQAVLVAASIAGLAAGASVAMGWLVSPPVLAGLLIFNLVILGTRLWAMTDALLRRGLPDGRVARGAAILLFAALVVTSLGAHGASAQLTWSAYDTLTTVFSPSGPQGGAFVDASPDAAPSTPGVTDSPAVSATLIATPDLTPEPTPMPDWAADGRINVLLVGADAGPGRWKLRTDTMILLTVDIDTGRAGLIGIPRNLRFVPVPPPLDTAFPDGFPDLLNALWVYVDEHPGVYPGDPAIAPFNAVRDTVGLLTGAQVDAMAVVELQGFVRAIDALGGLKITVPAAVYDAHYPDPDGTGSVELFVAAGEQHLDGWHALAYARTRHQDSDYSRMERQQTVLVALQRQLRCDFLPRLPDLLAIARDTLWTSLPAEALPGIIDVARRVDADRIARLTLAPPAIPELIDADAVERIRGAVRDLLADAPPSPPPLETSVPAPGC
jgi:LCP family protein required for cell wall assembly